MSGDCMRATINAGQGEIKGKGEMGDTFLRTHHHDKNSLKC